MCKDNVHIPPLHITLEKPFSLFYIQFYYKKNYCVREIILNNQQASCFNLVDAGKQEVVCPECSQVKGWPGW